MMAFLDVASVGIATKNIQKSVFSLIFLYIMYGKIPPIYPAKKAG